MRLGPSYIVVWMGIYVLLYGEIPGTYPITQACNGTDCNDLAKKKLLLVQSQYGVYFVVLLQ